MSILWWGGTQANRIVIESALKPYEGVLCADTGHINVHETGAVEATGHKVLAMPGKEGKITSAQISVAVALQGDDEHIVKPGMVYISQPTELGTIYQLAELTDISMTCRSPILPTAVMSLPWAVPRWALCSARRS